MMPMPPTMRKVHNQQNPSREDQHYMDQYGIAYSTAVRHHALRRVIADAGGFIAAPDELAALLGAHFSITTTASQVRDDLRFMEDIRLRQAIEAGLVDEESDDAPRMFPED